MTRPSWTWMTSSRARWAAPNWRELPPVVRLDYGRDEWPSGTWTGSGFQVRELPPYETSNILYYHDPAKVCATCKGLSTRCIYLSNAVCQTGVDIDVEIFCDTCGAFTQWNGFD